jgi:DNA-directed RNA polymerase sigma subunit (sigma70/sigma32)
MANNDRLRKKFPVFFAFGEHHQFLGRDEAQAVTPEARIRSIWPFILRRVVAFQRSLKSRERVNFDPEDTITELVVKLLEKDDRWEPERGKYITYAGAVIDHELSVIRDRSRTVQSPRNSVSRMREYDRNEAAGTLSERRRRTAEQVRRTTGGIQVLASFDRECPCTDSPSGAMERCESGEAAVSLMRRAIRHGLSPFESAVLGMSAGLHGVPPRSTTQIARAIRKRPGDVKRVQAEAYQKLRDFITENAPAFAGQK